MKDNVMKPPRFFLIFIILIYSTIFCFAQEAANYADQIRWTQVYSDKPNFSVLFPANFLVDNEEQKDWFLSPVLASLPDLINTTEKPQLTAHRNSVSMYLSIYNLRQVSRAKNYVWRFISPDLSNMPFQDFKIDNFVGRSISLNKDENLGTHIIMAVDNKVIAITARSKKEDKEIYETFLRSLKINGNSLFKSDAATPLQFENKISIAELKTSPEIIAALNQKIEKKEFKSNQAPDNLKIEKDINFSRPLIILRRPRNYPYLQPGEKFSGIVKVKVEFLNDGTIGDVSILSEAPNPLLKKLYAEIQEIKFLPAEVDGKKVNLVKMIEYYFDIK